MSYLFLVSLHVVGIESEYFVYTMYHTYVWEMNLVCAYHIIVIYHKNAPMIIQSLGSNGYLPIFNP